MTWLTTRILVWFGRDARLAWGLKRLKREEVAVFPPGRRSRCRPIGVCPSIGQIAARPPRRAAIHHDKQ